MVFNGCLFLEAFEYWIDLPERIVDVFTEFRASYDHLSTDKNEQNLFKWKFFIVWNLIKINGSVFVTNTINLEWKLNSLTLELASVAAYYLLFPTPILLAPRFLNCLLHVPRFFWPEKEGIYL